jgi:hypothetical protein
MLLERLREDQYPSWTQMNMIEQSIPMGMIPAYLELLLEKVQQDHMPSIPMLRRIQQVAESLPVQEQRSARRSS